MQDLFGGEILKPKNHRLFDPFLKHFFFLVYLVLEICVDMRFAYSAGDVTRRRQVADNLVVVKKRSNVRGAKGVSRDLLTTEV